MTEFFCIIISKQSFLLPQHQLGQHHGCLLGILRLILTFPSENVGDLRHQIYQLLFNFFFFRTSRSGKAEQLHTAF